MPTIKFSLNKNSIDNAIKELNAYKKSIPKKLDILCQRLAAIGRVSVAQGYDAAAYDGKKDITVTVEEIPNGYAIVASGQSLLFVEFGSGVTYGDGHPMAPELGYGPGTWPDKHTRTVHGVQYENWENPYGWYLPKEAGGGHTFGNAPSMTMYETAKELPDIILDIAKEVFASD